MNTSYHFADNLIQKVKATSCIVVGIDPEIPLFHTDFQPKSLEPLEIESSLTRFCFSIIDAVHDIVPAVKFQSAFFEQYGTAGISALSKSVDYARANKLLVILDAKRGDIGSTSAAYAKAYLAGKTLISEDKYFSSGLEMDCITMNPFLGLDSIDPFIEVISKYKKGIFILARTSNPGAGFIQDIHYNGGNISELVASKIAEMASQHVGNSGYSCIGAVVGATFPEEAMKLRKIMPQSIFLVPGTGAQGGDINSIKYFFNSDKLGAIVPISRAISYSSQDNPYLTDYKEFVRKNTLGFIEKVSKVL